MNPLLPTIFNFLLGAWGVAESTGLLNTLGSANGKAGAIAATVISFGNMFAHAYSSAQPGPFMSVPSNPGRTTGLVLAFLFGFWVVDAKAADMARPVAAAPVAPYVDLYSGLYIGGAIGYGWDRGNLGATALGGPADFGDLSNAPQGFLGGGYVGYNYRIPGLFGGLGLDGLAGIEAAGYLGNVSGTAANPGFLNGTVSTTNDRWLARTVARFGLIYRDVLFYGDVGESWGGTALNITCGACIGAPPGTSVGSNSQTENGLTWGFGVEFPWFFGPQWKARVEYAQFDFGTNVANLLTTTPIAATQKNHIDAVFAGLNFKF